MTKRKGVRAFTVNENGCWVWNGTKSPKGYGRFSFGRKTYMAHRTAYRLFIGTLERGKFILHKCDNPPCINPEHLMQGTLKENQRQSIDRGRHYLKSKTHCVHGHPFSKENTYLYENDYDGISRKCKTCNRNASKKFSKKILRGKKKRRNE